MSDMSDDDFSEEELDPAHDPLLLETKGGVRYFDTEGYQNVVLVAHTMQHVVEDSPVDFVDLAQKATDYELEEDELAEYEEQMWALVLDFMQEHRLDNQPAEVFKFFVESVLACLWTLFDPELRNNILIALIDEILTRNPNEHPEVKIQLLRDVFNISVEFEDLKPQILQSLLKFSLESRKTKFLKGSLKNLKKWMDSWDLDVETRKTLFYDASRVAKFALDSNLEQEFLIEYLSQYSQEDSEFSDEVLDEASQAVIRATTSVEINTRVLMQLRSSSVVRALESHPKYNRLHALLNIMYEGTVDDFLVFAETNRGYLDELSIDSAQLTVKMRILTLCSLATKEPVLSFNDLREHLRLSDDEALEDLVIGAYSDGFLNAKIDSFERVVHFYHSKQRTFDKESWAEIHKKLRKWHHNVTAIHKLIRRVRLDNTVHKSANVGAPTGDR